MNSRAVIDDLSSFWMPFTANRQFKAAPRLIESAKGMYYRSTDGREILDGCAGLWCVNAGHCRDEIVEAVQNSGRHARLRADLPDGPPARIRSGDRRSRG